MDIEDWGAPLAAAQARLGVLERNLVLDVARVRAAGALEVDALEARAVLQSTAAAVQEQAHRHIAKVVSRCLVAVFGEGAYEFRVAFERKRGRTEAVLSLCRGGRAYHPASSAGGGVVDVVSFALRLACLLLTRPPGRRLLVLDEPGKMLSTEYKKVFGGLLLALAREADVQFLMVTHEEEFRVGSVIPFSLGDDDGR